MSAPLAAAYVRVMKYSVERPLVPRLLDLVRVGVVVLMTVTCDANQTGPRINCPKVFNIASGNYQVAATGASLPAPLEVSAGVDPNAESAFCFVLGAQIEWQVVSGGGSVTPVPAPPPLLSYSATWTLGPAVGTQVVRATWTDSPERQQVLFTATASSPQP